MAYTTKHSFSISALGGGAKTDMADYGITIIGGNWPFIPEPHTETVNVPGMVGGYTYVNEAKPGEWTMRVICDADEADLETLYQALDSFATATAPTSQYRIYLDGVDDRYWVGRRVSGVSGLPIGQRALEFDIVWQLDDPTPTIEAGT